VVLPEFLPTKLGKRESTALGRVGHPLRGSAPQRQRAEDEGQHDGTDDYGHIATDLVTEPLSGFPFEAGGEPEAEGEIEIRQLFELEELG
jgi:hypothetical protein